MSVLRYLDHNVYLIVTVIWWFTWWICTCTIHSDLLHCDCKINVKLFYSFYARYLLKFSFNIMFYNSGWLPAGNNNMSYRMIKEGGLHEEKFYGVFYNMKLTGSSLPIKNPLAHPLDFLPCQLSLEHKLFFMFLTYIMYKNG